MFIYPISIYSDYLKYISMKSKINLGKLRGKVKNGNNIIYYKRGEEELSLNITNKCPNSCLFCIRNTDVGWGVSNLYLDNDPSLSEIICAFDKESNRNIEKRVKIKKIKICGYGEPLVRGNILLPLIKHLHKVCPSAQIQIATTGWPFFKFCSGKKSDLKKLKEAGASNIFLSLNALNKFTYEKLVRPGINNVNHDAFDDSIRFGKLSKSVGLDVTLGFIKLGDITNAGARTFANSHDMKFKLREFEK